MARTTVEFDYQPWYYVEMKHPIVDEQKIDEILERSVKEIIPSREELKREFMSGRRLSIYIGTDATGNSLHLGHATNYMILEKIRQLGHDVIFLVGDFTSRIGDPTDKGAARVQLNREQVIENTKTWLDQVRPIIDLDNKENPVRVLYNHDWLAGLNFEDVVNLASNFTVQQMLERDMFDKRMKENKPIYLHEFFYPLMQGYDSVAMNVDIEMIGNDQKFNALAGRTLLKKLKNKDKFVFITTLLENPKTKEKMMSKSLGTGVFLDATPNDMYGGIMAQPDENMLQLFIDCTWLPKNEISDILANSHPRDAKMRLAREIVSIYHGSDCADKAQEHFVTQFQNGGIPADIPEHLIESPSEIMDLLRQTGMVSSGNEAKRKIDEGAVQIDGRKIKEIKFRITREQLEKGFILKLGRKIYRITGKKKDL